MTKNPVFDFVPFARSGWKMADHDFQSFAVGPLLKAFFPEPAPRAVASSSVGEDKNFTSFGAGPFSGFSLPAADASDCKFGGVVVGSDVDPASVLACVVDSVGSHLAFFLINEIVGFDFQWAAFGIPFLPRVLVVPYQFFLFCVDWDDGRPPTEQEGRCHPTGDSRPTHALRSRS